MLSGTTESQAILKTHKKYSTLTGIGHTTKKLTSLNLVELEAEINKLSRYSSFQYKAAQKCAGLLKINKMAKEKKVNIVEEILELCAEKRPPLVFELSKILDYEEWARQHESATLAQEWAQEIKEMDNDLLKLLGSRIRLKGCKISVVR